ncbi:uncharacterized protein [Onthophagus taurus]|uniref:uncharacterized protein n=1 Tax=Onthophagus taurus TaxID=166361 RepID=UPI0039BE87AD
MNKNIEFQDSDEDVYYGPITLKEKKRDVLRKLPIEYITGRSSVSTNPSFIEDKSMRLAELITCDLPTKSSISEDDENFIQKVAKELDLTVPAEDSSISDHEFKEEISTTYHSISSNNSSLIEDVVNISSEKENSMLTEDSNSSDDFDNKQEGTYEIPKFTAQNHVKDLIDCFNNLDVIEEVDENTQFDSNPSLKITPSEEKQTEIQELMEQSKAESPSSSNSSFKFNDTLEEMDRFLMYGQNYRMSYENVENIKVSNETDYEIKEEIQTPKIQFNKPTGIPVLSRSATKTPVHKQINLQNRLPRSTGKDRFKDIQSPVAMYIKNSGYTPLFRTVTPGKVNKENIPEPSSVFTVNSAIDTFAFPAVRYKPAKKQQVIEEEFKLPPSINTLIPLKAKVGLHQRKGRQLSSIVDGDLTIDCSLNSSKDVSVVEKKNIFL